MPADYLELNAWQVAAAAALILINAGISLAWRLDLERSLALASVRTVVQLTLVGMVLEWVFRVDRWYLVLAMLVVMTVVAGTTAVQRCGRRYDAIWIDSIISMWASSWLVTAFALLIVFRGIPKWYQPQYAIPLMGMVLGNTLNGISLGLNAFTESLAHSRHDIETRLALGARRGEAAQEAIRNAVRTAMIPTINSMMIVGLVSLPGMMTGQLLSGTSPLEAVKYQIVIMFLIASGTALGGIGVVLLAFHRTFSTDHQLLSERLYRPSPRGTRRRRP